MIYSVLFNDTSIFGYDGDVTLIEPKVTQELNAAGSFEFTMPPLHPFYGLPEILTPEVEVYEGDHLIFFGRPTEIEIDTDLQKRVYCEGALAYFSDSIQRPMSWDSIDVREFFSYLVEKHNEQVPENRRFTVGNVTVTSKFVARELSYQSTLSCLLTMCVEVEGGYLMARKENGVRYIDWYADAPFVGTQPIRLGLNIMEMTQRVNSNFATSVIALGTSGLTIAQLNGGRDYLDSEYVSIYGRITTTFEYDTDDPEVLMAKAAYFLATQQYGSPVIDVTATELHYLEDTYTPFLIGQKVHVYSAAHGIDAMLPIVKLELHLDTADKEITVGTLERKELTELIRNSQGELVYGNTVYWDQTPTEGSNRAVTSAGVFAALGPLRFTVNEDGTVTVKEVSSGT